MRHFLTVSAVFGVAYGLLFLAFPSSAVALYGVDPEPHVVLNLQYFGSALVGLGVLWWASRNFSPTAIRGVLIAGVVGDVGGLFVTLSGIFHGLINAMAWSSAIVYGLFIIGSIYFLSARAPQPA